MTRSFRETVQNRAQQDADFQEALLKEGIDLMLADELETGKNILRDYVSAIAAGAHRTP